MENLQKILSGPFATSLGWVLLHSVWQVLLLSVIYLVVNISTKNALIRYWVGMSLMASQLLISLATFGWVYDPITQINLALVAKTEVISMSFFVKSLIYLKQNLPILVGLWSIGSGILFLKMLTGYMWMVSLKTKSKTLINKNIISIFEDLKNQMGIKNNILLKSSNLTDVPVMLGYFKPVVLLPAGMIGVFSMKQIEMILAHELAHIKRNDYLFNLLQSILDVIYFFHPAFWIISTQVRKEREICTDQIALAYTGDKILLANTLIQLQESKQLPSLALAFGKKQSAFTERIHRMLGIKSNRWFSQESIWVVIGLFLSIMAIGQVKKPQSLKQPDKQENVVPTDTLVKPMSRLTIQSDNNNFTIKDKKLFFNGKEIELSPEKRIIAEQHLETLEKQNIQIEFHTKQMEEQSKLMETESQKLNDWSKKLETDLKPLETYSLEIAKLSKEIEKKAKELSQKSSKLKPDTNEFEKLHKNYEAEIDKISLEIDAISDKMNEVTNNSDLENEEMQKISEEMDRKSAEMEKISEPIELISQEIDKTVNQIIALLPQEIRSKVHTDFQKAPKAPKPPKFGKNAIAPPPPPLPPNTKRIGMGSEAPPPPPLAPEKSKSKAKRPSQPPLQKEPN
jgi:beta-lactamase regulating signal transducer with metallopeptidase domain